MRRLLVIGLDGATPELVFESWRDELPVLGGLMKQGIYGKLRSTIPPITIPAWTSMLSSKDPGQLGLYGFRNRKNHRYESLYIANASHVKEKRVWDYLEERRLTSILIGVPQTYPPKPIRGMMVASFLAPDKSVDYTYPARVKTEIDRIAGGDYVLDVKDFRTDDKAWLLDQIHLMTRRRFKVVRHYLHEEPWDFFMFVEMGTDRIHHGFWRYQDPGHRFYEAGTPYESAIKDYYQVVDREIGELLAGLDPETAVMVVSDHGAKRMDGAVCINEWLRKRGYLHLRGRADRPVRLTVDMIDWENTAAWAEGGYYARVFLNVRGREPQGTIPSREYEAFRDRLEKDLEVLEDEDGRSIDTRVFKPEDIYRSTRNVPPDLMVYFGDLHLRAVGIVGHERVRMDGNDTGPDDANHSEDGVFVLRVAPAALAHAGLAPGREVENLSIYDVAPTILDAFGIPIPGDMIGRSIFEKEGETASTGPFRVPSSVETYEDYTEEEEEAIRKRLEDLGYI